MRPKHRVGLPRGCLAIHEDCPVVALKRCLGNGSHYRAVDCRGLNLRSEYVVKLKALGLNCILIPSSELFFTDESVDVDLTAWHAEARVQSTG